MSFLKLHKVDIVLIILVVYICFEYQQYRFRIPFPVTRFKDGTNFIRIKSFFITLFEIFSLNKPNGKCVK